MQSRLKLNKTLAVTFALIGSLAASMLLFSLVQQKDTANALSPQDFNAGRIIDDGVFYNKDAMNAPQIQDFLNRLTPNCDTWGTQPSGYGNLNNAQYAQQIKGWAGPPYVCINNYYENPNTGETSYEKGGGAFAGGISAAQIIYDAAQTYDINPQVLLVSLKKESAGPLTADTWPLKAQYKYAMGYACPDSGPNYSASCDASKAGFYKQVMLAAWQLNYYKEHPNDYRYGIGWNDIQYSTDPSCGTKRVNIENMATLSLYIYTPYTPNDGALANYPGQAPCGSYGNRNFFMFFNEWFGSTYGNGFTALQTPRWMQVGNSGAQKVFVYSGDPAGSPLPAGQQIRFVDKILVNGTWYLRTEFNHNDNTLYAVPQSQLKEIPYQPITPKWVTLTSDGNRSQPSSRTSINDTLARGTAIKVVDQITVDGNVYYRTEFNHNNNQDAGIHSRFVSDFTPIPLSGPRNFCANTTINKINPLTGQVTGSANSGVFMINKKSFVNGVWYYQAASDNGTSNFFDSRNLHDACYVSLEGPRAMRLNQDAVRFNTYTGALYDTLPKDTIVDVSTKILINGQWYFRTTYNTQNNIDAIMRASAFSNLPAEETVH